MDQVARLSSTSSASLSVCVTSTARSSPAALVCHVGVNHWGEGGRVLPNVESGTLMHIAPRCSKMPLRIRQKTPFQAQIHFLGK